MSYAAATDGRQELAFIEALLHCNPADAVSAVRAPPALLSSMLPGSSQSPDSVDIDGFSCRISLDRFQQAIPRVYSASVGGATIPASSADLHHGSSKWRFFCTVNSNIYIHVDDAVYEKAFGNLPAPMLPSVQWKTAADTNRQTFTIDVAISALEVSGCTDLAIVCYGLKQPVIVENWKNPALRFPSNDHNWLERMLDHSEMCTLDVGVTWSDGGRACLFHRPGSSVPGLRLFEVLTPLQCLTWALRYLKANPEDAKGERMPTLNWGSGTITAYCTFLKKMFDGDFEVAADGKQVGHSWYKNGLRGSEFLPSGSKGASGVACVCLYNHNTRHMCVTSQVHRGLSQVGTVRRKNKPPSPNAQGNHGPGQPPPWGPQQVAAARDRHSADLRRDSDALNACADKIQRFPSEKSGGVRSEAKIVCLLPSAYPMRVAFRDGCLAALAVADTSRSGIRVAARVQKDVQDGLVAAVLKWAAALRGNAQAHAHLLQQAVSQMGTHEPFHSASRSYMRQGDALRAILAPVAAAGLQFTSSPSSSALLLSPAEVQRNLVRMRLQRLLAIGATETAAETGSRYLGVRWDSSKSKWEALGNHYDDEKLAAAAARAFRGASRAAAAASAYEDASLPFVNSAGPSSSAPPLSVPVLVLPPPPPPLRGHPPNQLRVGAGTALLSGVAFMGGLVWQSHRDEAAHDLSASYPQEHLSESDCDERFRASSSVQAIEQTNASGLGCFKACVYIPKLETPAQSLPKQQVILATAGSKAEACFAVSVYHAFMKLAHSRVEHVPENEYARMGFSGAASGKRKCKFMHVKSIDQAAPGPSHVSAEAENLAQCATAKRLVWPMFQDGNRAVREQRALVPLEGSPSATEERKEMYVSKGLEARISFRNFRVAAADFVRARFQYQCAARAFAPAASFFVGGTSAAPEAKRARREIGVSGDLAFSLNERNSSSSSSSSRAAAIDIVFPGERGCATGYWGDGFTNEDEVFSGEEEE